MPSIWMDVDTVLAEVPINIAALIDDSDFKSREESLTFEPPGLDLVWNFITTAGAYTQTAVTPAEFIGDYFWVHQGNGMYTIEIPFSGGASINNDAEGFGWFSGIADGVLPWIGPTIGFRAAALNNLLVDTAVAGANLLAQYDTTGLLGDTFPLRQDQGASIAGGLAIHTGMASVTAILGTEQDLANASTVDGNFWVGNDIGSGAEFIFRCTPADTDSEPGDLHFSGFYDEPGAPFTNTAELQVYNFVTSVWDTLETFTNASSNEPHDNLLLQGHMAPGSGTVQGVAHTIGDVLIKFVQIVQETGNAVLKIDAIHVGFIGSSVTAGEIADAVWDETRTGHVDAGKAGQQLWTDIDAILADTANMQPKLGTPTADISADIAAVLARGNAAWVTATGFAVAGDAMALTGGERTTTADVILLRQMSNIDNATEDSYNLYSLIMARLNSEIISGVWTIFQTDGEVHQEKDVESSASANAVTKVSG